MEIYLTAWETNKSQQNEASLGGGRTKCLTKRLLRSNRPAVGLILMFISTGMRNHVARDAN